MADVQQESALVVDRLSAALTDAANSTVDTSYGEIPLKDAIESGDLDIWAHAVTKLDEQKRLIGPLLKEDHRFPGDTVLQLRVDAGTIGLYPNFAAHPLILQTMALGSADEAIQWLERVLAAKTATGKVIEALWGVQVDQVIEFSETLRLVPTTSLPDGPRKMLLLGHRRGRSEDLFLSPLGMELPRSVLVADMTVNDVIFSPDEPQHQRAVDNTVRQGINELLQDVTSVLSMVGPRIAISAAIWFEFDDPDLRFLSTYFSGRHARYVDVIPLRPMTFPVLDPDEAVDLVRRFLALPNALKKKIRVALNRLNTAQRRFSIGDKSIDICIALESLLGGTDKNEVTHKVTTRAARLLGGTIESRLRNRDIVNLTYRFRSSMVHEGTEPTGDKPVSGVNTPVAMIVEEAVGVCVRVIKTIMHSGSIPDWKEFDVQAGA